MVVMGRFSLLFLCGVPLASGQHHILAQMPKEPNRQHGFTQSMRFILTENCGRQMEACAQDELCSKIEHLCEAADKTECVKWTSLVAESTRVGNSNEQQALKMERDLERDAVISPITVALFQCVQEQAKMKRKMNRATDWYKGKDGGTTYWYGKNLKEAGMLDDNGNIKKDPDVQGAPGSLTHNAQWRAADAIGQIQPAPNTQPRGATAESPMSNLQAQPPQQAEPAAVAGPNGGNNPPRLDSSGTGVQWERGPAKTASMPSDEAPSLMATPAKPAAISSVIQALNPAPADAAAAAAPTVTNGQSSTINSVIEALSKPEHPSQVENAPLTSLASELEGPPVEADAGASLPVADKDGANAKAADGPYFIAEDKSEEDTAAAAAIPAADEAALAKKDSQFEKGEEAKPVGAAAVDTSNTVVSADQMGQMQDGSKTAATPAAGRDSKDQLEKREEMMESEVQELKQLVRQQNEQLRETQQELHKTQSQLGQLQQQQQQHVMSPAEETPPSGSYQSDTAD